MKTFITTGKCIPSMHYMVDISNQVEMAAQLVRTGNYFCINRGRQYGKTTTLSLLKKKLECEGLAVFSLSFEGLEDEVYSSLPRLLYASLYMMYSQLVLGNVKNISPETTGLLNEFGHSDDGQISSLRYKMLIPQFCSNGNIVLLIDEVDQAGNHLEFIKFLGLLRNMYLNRDETPTFKAVVLAGVYDVKNLKLKIRSEEDHQYNSPWNIAANYDPDMSLPADGISTMLAEYKTDHSIEFDVKSVGQMIYDYTSGYPFLVSRICEIIDSSHYTWDKAGVLKATHDLLLERNTLFDDMIKKLDQYPELKDVMKHILYSGSRYAYNPDEKYMQIALMFNFVKIENGGLAIACRLMETRMYNFFLSEEKMSDFYQQGDLEKVQFVHDGYIDMRHLIERFSYHFNKVYKLGKDDKFVEENGRKIFLMFLRPIINGVGNYYCEARTRDLTRTDVIIDYLGNQYVVELKIWRGNAYNERGEEQLAGYLDCYNLSTGYLVSFCFNENKQPGLHDVMIGDRRIIEAII